MILYATRTIMRVALLAIGVLLILFALLTLGARLLLPMASGYKSDVEGRLAEYLDRPVTIGALDLAWRSNGPELRLDDVSVFESDTRSVRFRELLVDLDLFSSLARRTPIIDELTLVGAELAIDYTGDGHFVLHGAERPLQSPDVAGSSDAVEQASGDAASADTGLDVIGWLLNIGKVALLDTRLIIDDADSGQTLTVDAINVRAENAGSLHRLRLDLDLPERLGRSLEAGIDFDGSSRRLGDSTGDFYVKGTELHLNEWRALRSGLLGGMVESPENPLRMALAQAVESVRADADAEVWGNWKAGEIDSARARIDVQDIRLGGTGDDPVMPLLDTLQADLAYRDDVPGWTVQADRIELSGGGDDTVIEAVEFGRGSRAEPGWRFSVGGERLSLALLARAPEAILAQLDDTEANGLLALARLDPRGTLRDWRVDARGLEKDPRVSITGDLVGLGARAAGRRPAIDGIDGRVRIIDNRGQIVLTGQGVELAQGEQVLTIDALDLTIDVDGRIPEQTRADGQLSVLYKSASLSARAGITLEATRSPRVDLQGNYTIGDLADVPDWLSILGAPAPVSRWFERAIQGGRADNGIITWFGRLADFPYADGSGVFRSSFDLADGRLAFLPDWPTAELHSGKVMLEGMSLVARTRDANLKTFEAGRVEARIGNLFRPMLSFEASGNDALQSLVDFSRDGPLRPILGTVLAEAGGDGRAGLDIALDLPLSLAGRSALGSAGSATGRVGKGSGLIVDGSLFLDGNALQFGRADLELAATRGAIGFNERGVRIGSLKGKLFGQSVSIDGETTGQGADAVTELHLRGVLEAADVLAHYALPLDRFVGGASRWDVTLTAPHSTARIADEGVQLRAISNLLGTDLLLPAPLAKPSGQSAPFVLATAFREGDDTTQWQVTFDQLLSVAVDIDANGLRSLGARLGGGVATVPTGPGIAIEGHVTDLAFDGWASAVATLLDDLPASEERPTPILPVFADLTTDALSAGTMSLGKASLKATTDESYINAVVENVHLAGSIRYPRQHWLRKVPALLRLGHIDRMLVDALASAPDADAPDDALDPRNLPAIEAHVSSLRWGALALKDVSFNVGATDAGISFVARAASRGETALGARGYWRVRDGAADATRPGAHESEVALDLSGNDLGAGLAAAGFPGVLAEGAGEAQATLGWRGPLYLPELSLLVGDGRFDIERGSVVALDPGAARLVGLFALQSIPRRLSLDFSDLTADGLAFEKLSGDVSLAEGIANVGLVQLTGPVGVIDITGTSNLVTQEYDQRVTVLPRISAALPIIGLISAGATGGISALVAGGVLKAIGLDVDRIGLRRFTLTGSWDDPVFESRSSSVRTGR